MCWNKFQNKDSNLWGECLCVCLITKMMENLTTMEQQRQNVGDEIPTASSSSNMDYWTPCISSEIVELKHQLEKLQNQRQIVQQHQYQQEQMKYQLQNHLHQIEHEYLLTLQHYKGWKYQHKKTFKIFEQESCQWNVLNDAFIINHQGPFGTINGCRLGSEATTIMPYHTNHPNTGTSEGSSSTTSMTSSALGMMASTVMLPGRMFGFGGGGGTPTAATQESNSASNSNTASQDNTNPSSDSGNASNTTTSTPTSLPSSSPLHHGNSPSTKVPWTEINSALGQVALLLSIMEQSCSNISFPHHVIIPMGSTSKIGIRQPNAITGYHSGTSENPKQYPVVAMYPLFSDDASGIVFSRPLFGKRNFNLGLRSLTECIYIVSQAIQKHDPTLLMPFDIHIQEMGHPNAPCTINGISVHYIDNDHNSLLQWTRVMKYLLANVKWCIAYMTKHVDR